jgi:predicted ATPase
MGFVEVPPLEDMTCLTTNQRSGNGSPHFRGTKSQQQDARLWELRSATSLARLWATLGRRAGALDLITPMHDWFTEGLDMPDLTGARTLMAELSA